MRVVFMGTPALAAAALQGLHAAGYTIPLVITQPDKRQGRGRQLVFSPVKALALDLGLPVAQPEQLGEPGVLERILAGRPEVIVVAAYGKLLPPALLSAAPLGCLNIHASLLPAYRGAAPIQQALLDGAKETGVTIMQMDRGLDTGPMLLQRSIPIPDDMDFGGLYEALSDLGSAALLEALPLYQAGRLTPQPQPDTGSSYTGRLLRQDEEIDWRQSAAAIRNQIRAFSPWPGAATLYAGKEVKILTAELVDLAELGWSEPAVAGMVAMTAEAGTKTAPGAEMAATAMAKAKPGSMVGALRRRGPVIATGAGLLLLSRLRPAGKKEIDGWAWLNGSRMSPGHRFGGLEK